MRRLQEALEDLQLMIEPSVSGSISAIGGDSQWSDPLARESAARGKLRRRMKNFLDRIDTIAGDIEDTAAGTERDYKRSWKCSRCHRGQRPQAEFCDSCGLPKPLERIVSLPNRPAAGKDVS